MASACGDHAQAQLAVVQQQVHARLQRGDDLRVRQVDPALIARRGVEVQAQGLTAYQLHLALGELADPQFRALQVHQDAQRVVELALDFTDPLIALGVVGVIAVAEVQAEDVDPGLTSSRMSSMPSVAGPRVARILTFLSGVMVLGSRGSEWRGSR
jgi:hypothetical protein